MNGADILIKIGSNVVGSQTNVTFNENRNIADASSKNSDKFNGMAGRYSASVGLDALYVPSDVAWLALKSAIRSGTLVTVIKQENGVDVESASAFVASNTETGPDQMPATISAALTISGEWSPI